MQLEAYVDALKDIVGMDRLIEAVGIGRGKQDLTGIAPEPLKARKIFPIGSRKPSAKLFSTLAAEEIIDVLAGKLSKTKLRDLFWEAVWPRLLARGWHSEQTNKMLYDKGDRFSLVFLVPGVDKFERRKLTKGSHYFDSINYVLEKVASEPELLVLENAENVLANDSNVDQKGPPNCNGGKLSNIKPGTSNKDDDMKFTVVDMSMFEGKSKFYEVRSLLPTDTLGGGDLEEDGDFTPEEAEKPVNSVKIPFLVENKSRTSHQKKTIIKKGSCSGKKRSSSKASDPDTVTPKTKISKGQKTVSCNKIKSQVPLKTKVTSSANPKGKNSDSSTRKKRHRMSPCSTEKGKSKVECSSGSRLNKETDETDMSNCIGTLTSAEDMISRVETEKREPMTGPSQSDAISGVEDITKSPDSIPEERPKRRKLLDLNLPPDPDSEEEPTGMDVTENQVEVQEPTQKPEEFNTIKEPDFSVLNSEPHGRLGDHSTEKLFYFLDLNMDPERQSTGKPLTITSG